MSAPARLVAAPLGAFVGRAREREALDAMFAEGARLVTITGAGGVGKTRLVVEWARRDPARIFCELAAARDLDEACAVVASSLGTPLAAGASPGQAIEQLGDALARHGARLVVLDNFEQLAASSTELLAGLLERAPAVRFVVTSRERLRLDGECCLALDPLALPAPGASLEDIAASDAVILFVARARAVRAGFDLGAADAPAVASIVRDLDGIPLAIELCASRAGVLSPSQILDRLSRRFELLAVGARGAPARRATLRGAVDWSWDLLEPIEQDALAQCAVFHGGFSVEAAEGVIDLGAASGTVAILDVLHALCDKSLVHVFDAPGSPAERRYRLLETIRAYAEEKLGERRGAEAAAARHTAFFLSAACGGAVFGRDDVRRAAREVDNLLAVATRALAARDGDVALRALLLLEPILLVCARGRLAPYVAMLDAALAAPPPNDALAAPVDPSPAVVRARATYTRGLADLLRGRVADALLGFEHARLAARAAGSRADEARALTQIAVLFDLAERHGDAALRFDHAGSNAPELGDEALAGDWALAHAASLLWRGHAAESLASAEEAFDRLRLAGDLRGQSVASAHIAQACLSLGRYDDAERAAAATRELLAASEDRRTEAFVLTILGRVDQARGRFDAARHGIEQALVIHHGVGDRLSAGIARGYAAGVAWEHGDRAAAAVGYRDALALLRDTGERHYALVFRAAHNAVDVERGAVDPDTLSWVAVAEGAPLSTRVSVELYAGFADVVRARRAAEAGDGDAAERHLEAALARRNLALAPAAGGPTAVDAAEDVRLALRLLDRALPTISKFAAPQSCPALVVGPEARWFRIGEAASVHFLKARAARLMLLCLVRARADAPGRAIPLGGLFEAGWPGARLASRAASNRVHVNLTKLRKLGLSSVLQSRDDGFLLDPARAVVEAPEPRCEIIASGSCD